MICFIDQTCHRTFMVLIRTKDIKELEACCKGIISVLQEPEIEHMFRIPIGIHRTESRGKFILIGEAEFPIAIGRGRGSIDERFIMLKTPNSKHLAIEVVIAHEIIHITLGRRGTGTEMNDSINVAAFKCIGQILRKSIFMAVVLKFFTDKVAPLFGGVERINNKNIFNACQIEALKHHAPDKSCSAGKYYHRLKFLFKKITFDKSLVPSRSERYQTKRDTNTLFYRRKVGLDSLRQIFTSCNTIKCIRCPSFIGLIDRTDIGKKLQIVGEILDAFPIGNSLVTRTKFYLRLTGKNIQLCQRKRGYAVYHRRVTNCNGVKPAAATRTTCRCTILTTNFAKLFACCVKEFCRERSVTDSSSI